MYSRIELARKYLAYYLTASNGRGHGIHSPFVFDFVTRVLGKSEPHESWLKIENLRQQLLCDNSKIIMEDFGAGSVIRTQPERSVSSIAKNAAKPARLARVLFRAAQYYRPAKMLELGTSLGISGAYLAFGNPASRLITLEGAGSLAAIAQTNFKSLGLDNVSCVPGDFAQTLRATIASTREDPAFPGFDLVFVDGNHRKEPTLNYFNMLVDAMSENSVIIFDDIHWSAEMEACWSLIKSDPRVHLTIDLFFMGFVFFSPSFLIPQHFTIRY